MPQAISPSLPNSHAPDRAAPALIIGKRTNQFVPRRVWVGGTTLFAIALAVRLVNLNQPLVENFIDRQVHTAMMARNLTRGASWLRPQLDIGPFPAYYMLEFPGYPALALAAAQLTGMELDMSGRLVSALAMAAACVLLFDLVRRHDGIVVGVVAGLTLAAMPVTIRYGRSFQPDSLMFALLVAGFGSMDRWRERGRVRDLIVAAVATSAALLLKVIAAYVLLPLAYLAWARCGRTAWRRWELWAALAVVALPSAAWYVHAWHVASSMTTVSTTFWEADKWIALERLVRADTYKQLAYFIGWRVLTPVGVVLATVGMLLRAGRAGSSAIDSQNSVLDTQYSVFSTQYPTRSTSAVALGPTPGSIPTHGSLTHATQDQHSSTLLFHVWFAALVTYVPILARKVDHEHYYLALAPVAAVFIARALSAIATVPLGDRCYVTGRQASVGLAVALFATDAVACRSTFRDPREWTHVKSAAAAVRELTPRDGLVVGHSSVLFYADRRGFAFDARSGDVAYLLGTFGESRAAPTAIDLIEFYRQRGATHFVELLGSNREHDRTELFESIRSRYRVLRDEPGKFLVVALNE